MKGTKRSVKGERVGASVPESRKPPCGGKGCLDTEPLEEDEGDIALGNILRNERIAKLARKHRGW